MADRPPMQPPSPDELRGAIGGGELDRRLDRFAADARADDAVDARRRERWLRHQAGEEATIAGTLLDLAERATRVVVLTAVGGAHAGTIGAVAVDYCVVRTGDSRDVLVRMSAIDAVRVDGRQPHTVGTRSVAGTGTLVAALADLAGDRAAVTVTTAGGSWRGTLRSVGRDVVSVVLDGPRGDVVHVAVDAVVDAMVDAVVR